MTAAHDSATFRPLYKQIKILITQSLVAGEWKPGEAIPSEMELAERYKVSQGTVRKAIDELAAENILVRRQGKGTFVSTHTDERATYRFLRIARVDGTQERFDTRLVECKRVKASSEVARHLDIKPGTSVVYVKRQLVVNGKAVILDDIAVPAHMFRGLTAAKINEYHGSMYSLFETQFGVRMIRAEERIRAVMADEVNAALLEVPVGSPLLCIDRVAFTYGDKPVEWRRGLCVTDENRCYVTELG
jgi:GntR family transcriptional regulator